MSFMHKDEQIILMDPPGPLVPPEIAGAWTNERWLRPDDLLKLRDIGCETVWETVWWRVIEPKFGERDWTHVDAVVEKVTKAGLKVLLNTYHHPPQAGILPEKWFQRYSDGRIGSHLSLWNQEAQIYEHEFIREICTRYDVEQVMCINSLQADGETILQNEVCFYDDAAMESHGPRPINMATTHTQNWLRDSIIKTLLDQYHAFGGTEMWFGTHPVIRCPSNGNLYIEDIFKVFRTTHPNVELSMIQYTYFPHGPVYRKKMVEWKNKYDLQIFSGAEYCAGLPRHTPLAIQDGVKIILGATHPFIAKKRVDDQMLDIIANSISAMKNHKEANG